MHEMEQKMVNICNSTANRENKSVPYGNFWPQLELFIKPWIETPMMYALNAGNVRQSTLYNFANG
jgi:hypothetical protein